LGYTEVAIPIGNEYIKGDLTLVPNASALVVFAHGSGSSRFSQRNQLVAKTINQNGISTLLFDLLTEKEDAADQITRDFRFDISLLATRLITVTYWVQSYEKTDHLKLGYFGSSTGAAAALIAAAELGKDISAIVSRGGRTDLAAEYVYQVQAATLLIVGALDHEVFQLNETTFSQLNCPKDLHIVSQATHLFEEPGTLEEVAHVASVWFKKYIR
jgi:dienelactone hydrolase